MKSLRLPALAAALVLAACSAPAPTGSSAFTAEASLNEGRGMVGSGNNTASDEGGGMIGSGNTVASDSTGTTERGGNMLGSGN